MAEPIRSFEEFIAEAKRLNLTAADLMPSLAMRPEFDDCLSKDFKEAKATIMTLPEQDVRALAIAQYIQLQFHKKYGNTVQAMNAAYEAERNAGVTARSGEVETPSPADADRSA